MSTIYECCKHHKDVNAMLYVVHYAKTEMEAIVWLQQNGGGVYRNTLHRFEMNIFPNGK